MGIGTILKLAQGLVSLIQTLVGWNRDTSLKNEGRQLQASSDAQATAKEDKDAQAIRSDVDSLRHDQLDAELRRATSRPDAGRV